MLCQLCIFSILESTSSYAALSASTIHTITGNSPFLSLHEQELSDDLDELFSIVMPDGTMIDPKVTNILSVEPTNKLSEIVAIITADNVGKKLSNIDSITYQDNDGDMSHSDTPIVGTLTATWSYTAPDGSTKILIEDDLLDTFNACNAPYILTISANDVKVMSQYGAPAEYIYSPSSKSYTIKVNDYKICHISPSSMQVYATSGEVGQHSKYPKTGYNSNVWDEDYGFSITKMRATGKNFPTTAFQGAEFWLNVSNEQTDYTYTSSDPSIATVDSEGKVTFIHTRPDTPVTHVNILVTPKNSQYLSQVYGMNITKWARPVGLEKFNISGNNLGTYNAAIACGAPPELIGANNLDIANSYFFSRQELSNAPTTDLSASSWRKNANERASRDIDGTFVGEWGLLSDYSDSGFYGHNYMWSSDNYNSKTKLGVHFWGAVSSGNSGATYLAVCRD